MNDVFVEQLIKVEGKREFIGQATPTKYMVVAVVRDALKTVPQLCTLLLVLSVRALCETSFFSFQAHCGVPTFSVLSVTYDGVL